MQFQQDKTFKYQKEISIVLRSEIDLISLSIDKYQFVREVKW